MYLLLSFPFCFDIIMVLKGREWIDYEIIEGWSSSESFIGKGLGMEKKTYISIDLKSFYASVECMERGLDPMKTNLVVADISRTEKTICLAVSPALKAYGIPGRPRLFEVLQKIKEVNIQRQQQAPERRLDGSSNQEDILRSNPALAVDFVIAPPQMAHYMQISSQIYEVYLKYVSPDDVHVYSIDEVFIDATSYLVSNGMTAREMAMKMILDVHKTTGITATAGIGPNLYLCKVAMDIWAKHIPADENGVRIAELDEMSYRRFLWGHRPLTDFWRVGRGYAKKLEQNGLYTMGDIARCSIGKPSDFYNEELLYRLFGINAELLIDHAWGWEPCTIADIKAYRPESSSIGAGQVLQCPYPFAKARLVVQEMTDQLALDLVDKGLVSRKIELTVGYDIENLRTSELCKNYQGEVKTDRYGRNVPKHAHGTANLQQYTSSAKQMIQAVLELYDRIVNPNLLIRRISMAAINVVNETDIEMEPVFEQMDLFTDYVALEKEHEKEMAELEREKKMQKAMLQIKKKYGKNAILKGMNLLDGATAKERNQQIGGHKA